MKLITKSIENKLKKYPLYLQDGIEDKIIICKFFAPVGAYTWYVMEAEKLDNNDYRFFGLVINDQSEKEYGYFMLSELQSISLPFGLSIERDVWFDSCRLSKIID